MYILVFMQVVHRVKLAYGIKNSGPNYQWTIMRINHFVRSACDPLSCGVKRRLWRTLMRFAI